MGKRNAAGTATSEHNRGRLLVTLERMLRIRATDLTAALKEAAQLVAEALGADKVDVLIHEPATDTLVAIGTSDTPMGRRERAIGMDRLPIANGGRAVEVFQTGHSYRGGRIDEDPRELPGLVRGLGIRSEIVAPLDVADGRRGVLLASSASADWFSEDDLRFLEAVASWVGVVAHRAELVQTIAADAAERGRRLAAEELITVLAHDLRNYLTPVKGRVDLIRRRASRDDRPADVADAEASILALDRAINMISDLLDLARLEQGIFALRPQAVDLAGLARETADALRTGSAEIRVEADREVTVVADPERIRQLLENLLANAIRHAPERSSIVVRITSETRTDGEWALVGVADQGPGVPPDVLPRIFSRFAAGTGSPGLGLGLHIASRIAAAHGGELIVQSKPGEGACFQLSLPLAGPSVSDTPAAGTASGSG